MKKIYYLFPILVWGLLIFSGCQLEGVKEQKVVETELENQNDTITTELTSDVITKKQPIGDTIELNEGIRVVYHQKGDGLAISKNDMVKIDYRNQLSDGTVYDGNHLIQKSSIPFLVGWNLQTPGWDIALQKLRVGDDVDILIPAKLARGEKGIPGLVPPNEDNILSIRIIDIMSPIKVVDDIRIWKLEEWAEPGDSIKFEDRVSIHYWAHASSRPRYDDSYRKGIPFELVMGDGNIVPGLYKALHFGREGDKLMIHIPAKEAYGNKGLKDLVAPGDDLLYDIKIVSVEKR
ncbi:MAG: FKBP-type peptidyl-prolyl cis-trans isomerase [Crocinitomicaceae bacterium]|nr:FKBP-type peptidyl-prolyl cis-trans isomerase [Crocinitomicaceae bacterium]